MRISYWQFLFEGFKNNPTNDQNLQFNYHTNEYGVKPGSVREEQLEQVAKLEHGGISYRDMDQADQLRLYKMVHMRIARTGSHLLAKDRDKYKENAGTTE